MASATPDSTLTALFPSPTQPGSGFSPTQNPGVSSESGKALVQLLKHNHDKWHIYFNDRGFHNHSTHHLFAIYTLGAGPELLEAAYATHTDYQRRAFDSPGEITTKNWKGHFGDDKYYRAYLSFFTSAVLEKGIGPTLETYFFSTESNWESKKTDKEQPQMVNRLLSGLLHPLIHAGHAVEFEVPGMLAEGLAMACVTHTDSDKLVPQELFAPPSVGTLSRLTSALSLTSSAAAKSTPLFTIVARMLKDTELGPGQACQIPQNPQTPRPYAETVEKRGELINKYASQWVVDTTDAADVKAKIEELSWLVTVLYGVAGLQPGKDFSADFFKMHFVTSSLFIHSYLKHLSTSSQSILLKTYLSVVFTVWVSRGRPSVDIANFYEKSTAKPTPPGPQPTPAPETVLPSDLTPNPWLPIFQTTLVHPNEHLPKLQRALAHYAAQYGTAPAGKFAGTELEGAEKLDGSLFIRVSGLTANRLGWMREGQKKQEWDFTGFWN